MHDLDESNRELNKLVLNDQSGQDSQLLESLDDPQNP